MERKSISNQGLKLSKGFFIIILLFTGSFTFYYIFSIVAIPEVIDGYSNLTIIQACFSLVIALSLLLGSHLLKKFNLKIIVISSIVDSILIVMLFFLKNFIFIIISILTIGIFFGLSQLAFYTYFWKTTSPEKRGRIGGIIGFISLPFFFIANYLLAVNLDFLGKMLFCMSLSISGALTIIILKPNKKDLPIKPQAEYYPEKRVIILYTLPWLLFSLVNATLAKNISAGTSALITPDFYLLLISLQTVAALFGALGGGFIADFVGRRLTLILSMTLYGISSVFRAFLVFEEFFFFAFIAEGLSWGIFLTLYSFVVWGDLANSKNCAKVYAIGLMIFYVATGIGQLPSLISELSLVNSALISSLIVFLSNVPIVLSPELLSSDIQEKLKLRRYISTVKRISAN